jgi:uncharacterized protein YqeY
MNLQEQISKDIITAMKNKEKDTLEALRFMKSLFIQNNTSTKPMDDLSVIVTHKKKLEDSLTSYPEGSPFREKIAQELKIVGLYLPAPLTEQDVVEIINKIKSNGVTAMGDLMKELTPQIKGRFDGKRASDLVKSALN